jgi:signal transduction histidine kinase
VAIGELLDKLGIGSRAEAWTAEMEATYQGKRADKMRSRSRGFVIAFAIVWLLNIPLDIKAFPSYWHAFSIRGPEWLGALLLFLLLGPRRPARQVERWTAVTTAYFAIVSALCNLLIDRWAIDAHTTSTMFCVLVVPPLLLWSWRTALGLYLITAGGLVAVGLVRLDQAELGPYLIRIAALAFPQPFVLFGMASREKLARAEFGARAMLREANERLVREAEVRNRLFTNLSHDFRTPLAVIRGEAELLRRDEASGAEAESALRRIEAHARTLADLTDQLLELARLEAGRTPCRKAPTDVAATTGEIVSLLQPGDLRRRVTLVIGSSAVASVDPGHLRRILMNLISNGIRHLPNEGGEVVVTVAGKEPETGNDGVTVDVSNDGAGIPHEKRLLLFTRFASLDRDGSTAGGIGLPLARELAELNGGGLEFLLEDTRRTTFRLRLAVSGEPAVAAPTGEPSAVPAPAPRSAPLATGRDEGVDVLIVEDNPDMRGLLERVVAGAGLGARCASSLAEAHAFLARDPPRAVLSDVLLPDGSGFDLVAAVRASASLRAMPVIIVSALGSEEHRVRGLVTGADDYVAKPFSPEELRARLQAALDRSEAGRRALEAQRRDFLMELHDGVSATLARAALCLSGDVPPDSAAFRRSYELVRAALAESRDILGLLDARLASWDEIVAAIRYELSQECEAARLQLEFDATSDPGSTFVAPAIHHAMRRIAREGVTNVIRHSRAKRVRVRFELREEGDARIRIEDDGRGFAPGHDAGNGLSIIRRRALHLGGKAAWGSLPEGGAFVEATVPVSPVGSSMPASHEHVVAPPGRNAV